jgi:hypothetical protein
MLDQHAPIPCLYSSFSINYPAMREPFDRVRTLERVLRLRGGGLRNLQGLHLTNADIGGVGDMLEIEIVGRMRPTAAGLRNEGDDGGHGWSECENAVLKSNIIPFTPAVSVQIRITV